MWWTVRLLGNRCGFPDLGRRNVYGFYRFRRLDRGGFGLLLRVRGRGILPSAVFELGQAQAEIGDDGGGFGELPADGREFFADVLIVVILPFSQW